MSAITIGLAGNPNCGKTTLFNALTGTKQKVGNWPGVTVERKTGNYSHGNREIEVVDLPGIYSLAATSLDEKVAREYISSGKTFYPGRPWGRRSNVCSKLKYTRSKAYVCQL